MSPAPTTPRVRLSHADRHEQLLRVARTILKDEGADALTLSHLATTAGVTKPITYGHFGTRTGLLLDLLRESDARQYAALEASLSETGSDLQSVATAIAESYIACATEEGRVQSRLSAALEGNAEGEQLRQDSYRGYATRCEAALAPHQHRGRSSAAALRAISGTAESLATGVTNGEVAARDAIAMIAAVITLTTEV